MITVSPQDHQSLIDARNSGKYWAFIRKTFVPRGRDIKGLNGWPRQDFTHYVVSVSKSYDIKMTHFWNTKTQSWDNIGKTVTNNSVIYMA